MAADEATERVDDRTRVTTRTVESVEVTEETVEERELLCPNCNQWWGEDEIVPIGVGVKCDEESFEDGDVEDIALFDQLCKQCTETVFGEVPDASEIDGVYGDVVEYWDGEDFRAAIWSVTGSLISLAIAVGIASIPILVVGDVVTGMTEVLRSGFAAAGAENSGAFTDSLESVIGPALLIMMGVVIINVFRAVEMR